MSELMSEYVSNCTVTHGPANKEQISIQGKLQHNSTRNNPKHHEFALLECQIQDFTYENNENNRNDMKIII